MEARVILKDLLQDDFFGFQDRNGGLFVRILRPGTLSMRIYWWGSYTSLAEVISDFFRELSKVYTIKEIQADFQKRKFVVTPKNANPEDIFGQICLMFLESKVSG